MEAVEAAPVAEREDEAAMLTVAKPPQPPCCFNCTLPTVFYYSVVADGGYCGVSCLDPAQEWLYKKFEANLTRAPVGTTTPPCATQFAPDGERYTKYAFSDTHGVPGLLSVAVDFYRQTRAPPHACCQPHGNVLCFGHPVDVTIDGVRYCCPKGATMEQPCANKTVTEDEVEAKVEEVVAPPAKAAALKQGAAASCPSLAALRSPRVKAASFSSAALSGMWYEQAFIDIAQVGASCQTLNGTASADGGLSVDFHVTYVGKVLPFTITEVYKPDDATAGVYMKHAQMPGGKLLNLPTVVVDVSPQSYVLFSCLELPLLPPVMELVVVTRGAAANATLVASLLGLAKQLGVPFEAADVRRVDHHGCK